MIKNLSSKDYLDASTKVNNSSYVFRNLIESLKRKPNVILNKDQISDLNPQQSASQRSKKMFYSENHSVQMRKSLLEERPSIVSPRYHLDDVQEIIKLKPKGNISGRDKVQRKSLGLSKQSMNKNLSSLFEPQRTRNSVFLDRTTKQKSQTSKNQLPLLPQSVSSKGREFFQNKLNRFMCKSKSFQEINQKEVIRYCLQFELNQNAQAKQIFRFFSELCQRLSIFIQEPFIKKFRNCVYFGQPMISDSKYNGFLYYFDHRIYYGEFVDSHKYGQGVEIHYDYEVIYKGKFQQGKKNGKFEVQKPGEHYVGVLLNGLYNGRGKLTTLNSVYEGFFENGQKHGYGVQLFRKTGLKLSGVFYRGYFDTKNQSSSEILHKKYTPKNQKKIEQIPFNDYSWKHGFSKGIQIGQLLFNHHLNQSQMLKTNLSKVKQRDQNEAQYYKFDQINKQKMEEFDHSFDLHSRQDTDFSKFGRNNLIEKEKFGLSKKLSMIEERVETNQLEDPLPMPIFLKK